MTQTRQEWIDDHPEYPCADWYDSELDYYKDLLKILGVVNPEIRFSGFSSQGDGACFRGEYRWNPEMHAKLKEYVNVKEVQNFAECLTALQTAVFLHSGKHYGCSIMALSSGYSHSGTMDVSDISLGDDWVDDDFYGGGFGLTMDRQFLALFRKIADWIYKNLEQAYDWHFTDEAIDEAMAAEA